jgi:archaellum component FlaF (FlaF/FlaG flagellin family)
MIEKKGWVLNLALFLIIILVILVGIYFLYLNIPGKPENLNPVIVDVPELKNQTFNNVIQFFPNMKFNHNSISYKIDSDCSGVKRSRMIMAFNDLESKIGLISFKEVVNEGDIEVSCSEEQKESIEKNYFIAGEGGAKEVIQTGRYNIIANGTVLLYKENGRKECDWSNVELHELVHVFGFGHSTNPDSLMYPYLEDCNQELDESIINELRRLYSEENLVDLYFDDVNVVKKGKYLDFNLTIKNSGSINSESSEFSVLEEGKVVEDFDLEKINYGAGIIIEIKNLRLRSRNPDEIRFIIDRKDLIKEIDEENNVALVSFDD